MDKRDLPDNGTIGHSEIMAEFELTGKFDLSADGAALIDKSANAVINESDFYGASAASGPPNLTPGPEQNTSPSTNNGTPSLAMNTDGRMMMISGRNGGVGNRVTVILSENFPLQNTTWAEVKRNNGSGWAGAIGGFMYAAGSLHIIGYRVSHNDSAGTLFNGSSPEHHSRDGFRSVVSGRGTTGSGYVQNAFVVTGWTSHKGGGYGGNHIENKPAGQTGTMPYGSICMPGGNRGDWYKGASHNEWHTARCIYFGHGKVCAFTKGQDNYEQGAFACTSTSASFSTNMKDSEWRRQSSSEYLNGPASVQTEMIDGAMHSLFYYGDATCIHRKKSSAAGYEVHVVPSADYNNSAWKSQNGQTYGKFYPRYICPFTECLWGLAYNVSSKSNELAAINLKMVPFLPETTYGQWPDYAGKYDRTLSNIYTQNDASMEWTRTYPEFGTWTNRPHDLHIRSAAEGLCLYHPKDPSKIRTFKW